MVARTNAKLKGKSSETKKHDTLSKPKKVAIKSNAIANASDKMFC